MAVNEIVAGRAVGRGSESFRIQTGISESSGSEADGWNIEGSWRRDGGNREPGWSFRGRHLSEGFVTLDGSFDQIDANQRDVAADLWYNIRYDRTWFRKFGVSTDNRYAQRLNGDLYVRTHSVGGDMELLPGTSVSVRYRDMERPPYHDRTVQTSLAWNTHRLYTTGRAGAQYGQVKDGEFLHAWVEQGFHPLPRFNTRLRAQWRRHDLPVGHEDRPEGGVESRYQLIASAQYDITSERAVSGRIIQSHNGTNGYVTFQQVVRSGMDLFLIVGDPSADQWTNRVALKAMIVLGGVR
jgi:hypothetical protein